VVFFAPLRLPFVVLCVEKLFNAKGGRQGAKAQSKAEGTKKEAEWPPLEQF
jgi:hypothetical protein